MRYSPLISLASVYGTTANASYSELILTYQLQRLSGIDQKLAILPLTGKLHVSYVVATVTTLVLRLCNAEF